MSFDAEWREHAECRNHDSNLFFPSIGQGQSRQMRFQQQIIQAKAICEKCPVQELCLDWALNDARDDWSILGGLTGPERRNLKRGRGNRGWSMHLLQPCGTVAAHKRHYRRGEPPCEPCRQAHNKAQNRRDKIRRRRTA